MRLARLVPDGAAVDLGQVPGDEQPEPAPLPRTGTGGLGADRPVEQVLADLVGDPGTVIGHHDQYGLPVQPGHHLDGRFPVRDRVGQQVGQDLFQMVAVDQGVGGGGELPGDLHPGRQARRHRVDHLGHRYRCPPGGDRTAVQVEQQQHVVDHADQPPGVPVDLDGEVQPGLLG